MNQGKGKPTAAQRRNRLITNILTLIVLALLVFEGKSLISLFSAQSMQDRIRQEEEEVFASANIQTTDSNADPSDTGTESNTANASSDETVSDDSGTDTSDTETSATAAAENSGDTRTVGLPNDDASYLDVVVPAQDAAVDDSYFEDAVFIGDSRMQGFRNLSGITKGSFVTAVGMELENFYTEEQIPTADGNVKVMDALKNLNYNKIYMMLGTNELGAYDMEEVGDTYSQVLADIKTCAASADPTVYVYSVVYVEESLVTTGDYVNNANVDTVNAEILEMCREQGYHYINLNEVLSDGNHALISGAAEDGVHLNQEYCAKWLEYTRTHYVV